VLRFAQEDSLSGSERPRLKPRPIMGLIQGPEGTLLLPTKGPCSLRNLPALSRYSSAALKLNFLPKIAAGHPPRLPGRDPADSKLPYRPLHANYARRKSILSATHMASVRLGKRPHQSYNVPCLNREQRQYGKPLC
jgi:hypothetical protein